MAEEKERMVFTEASKNLYLRSKGLGEALWKTDKALGWLGRTPLCKCAAQVECEVW